MAGGVGIEPTLTVLETAVLPLYEPPVNKEKLMLLSLFVFGRFLAPLAEFLQHESVWSKLFIFLGMIVNMMTNRAFQVDQIIL